MKKILLIFTLSLLFTSAAAQKVVIGERIPELRIATWIKGQQPAEAQLTYIEFFHASNPTCITSLKQLKSLADKLDARLHVVVVLQEKDEAALALLTPFISKTMSAGIDLSGRTFLGFGINYVPSGVLADAKNRVLWQGNSLQLTEALIEKITK